MDRSDADYERLLGDQLGEGSARIVYAHKLDPALVVKVSKSETHSSNRTEWHVWNEVQGEPDLSCLLGACHEISESGRFLIMERLDALTTETQRLARRYPGWLNDIKATAFGVAATGEVKIRDYGMIASDEPLTGATVHDLPPDEQMDQWLKLMDGL